MNKLWANRIVGDSGAPTAYSAILRKQLDQEIVRDSNTGRLNNSQVALLNPITFY